MTGLKSGDDARSLTHRRPFVAQKDTIMARIELPSPAREDVVHLRDTEADVDRKFTFHILTRSRKADIREVYKELEALGEELPKDAENVTDDQEQKAMRLTCDLISLLLKPGKEDGPAAGDMLYEAWLDERITDDQITGLLGQLQQSAQDPT